MLVISVCCACCVLDRRTESRGHYKHKNAVFTLLVVVSETKLQFVVLWCVRCDFRVVCLYVLHDVVLQWQQLSSSAEMQIHLQPIWAKTAFHTLWRTLWPWTVTFWRPKAQLMLVSSRWSYVPSLVVLAWYFVKSVDQQAQISLTVLPTSPLCPATVAWIIDETWEAGSPYSLLLSYSFFSVLSSGCSSLCILSFRPILPRRNNN